MLKLNLIFFLMPSCRRHRPLDVLSVQVHEERPLRLSHRRKPSQPGISTNLLVHTDKRTYNLDFTATDNSKYIRSVAFSYQTNDLTAIFTKSQQNSAGKKPLEDELQLGTDGVNFDTLYTSYIIIDKNRVDWKPDAIFDEGQKTYIRMPLRFSETSAFYESHWLPLYKARGLMWHDPDAEDEAAL